MTMAAPSGHYPSTVTWLETDPRRAPSPVLPTGVAVEPWRPGPAAYLALFRRVGDPWLWHGHLELGPAGLARLLALPATRALRLRVGATPVGFCLLHRHRPADFELQYCGLLPGLQGRGLGQLLLGAALAMAASAGSRRLWLHTCSEDHPCAVGFYRRHGLRVFHREREWVHDPRLRGLLPPTAGCRVPLAGSPGGQDTSGPSGAGTAAAPAAGNRR